MLAASTLARPFTSPAPSVSPIWETVPCNLCGSTDVTTRYQGTTDHDTETMIRSYSASGNFISEETLVECRQCSLVFTSPRLKRDLILRGYVENEDPNYVSQASGRIRSFEGCLKQVERFAQVGTILDVGAAAGFFLKVAKDKGWVTFGIEPSKFLADFGNRNYGVNVFCGTLEDSPKWRHQMDVVTLWDVLEHTFDPRDTLVRCNRYLKPNGHIVVNYPDIGSVLAKLAGRKWWFIISVHLYYFTPKTIAKLLAETGFEVVETGPHFQSLDLGYLLYRLEAYFPRLAKLASRVASALGLSKMLIPYYAAQTRVIARKTREA